MWLNDLWGEFFWGGAQGVPWLAPSGIAIFGACLLALGPREPFGFDTSLAVRRNHDFYLFHAAPPWTWMVSLIDPSANGCSVQLCPWRRLSIFAFSTA